MREVGAEGDGDAVVRDDRNENAATDDEAEADDVADNAPALHPNGRRTGRAFEYAGKFLEEGEEEDVYEDELVEERLIGDRDNGQAYAENGGAEAWHEAVHSYAQTRDWEGNTVFAEHTRDGEGSRRRSGDEGRQGVDAAVNMGSRAQWAWLAVVLATAMTGVIIGLYAGNVLLPKVRRVPRLLTAQ